MKTFLSILAVVLACGCVTSSKKMLQISPGMTKTEVVSILGNPASASVADGFEYLNFRLSGKHAPPLNPNHSGFAEDYFVRFKDGRVDQFGRSEDFQNVIVGPRQ